MGADCGRGDDEVWALIGFGEQAAHQAGAANAAFGERTVVVCAVRDVPVGLPVSHQDQLQHQSIIQYQ